MYSINTETKQNLFTAIFDLALKIMNTSMLERLRKMNTVGFILKHLILENRYKTKQNQ